jgi:general stress protein YciG
MSNIHRRGFASLTPEQRRAISSKGGLAVDPTKRAFKRNRSLASKAGRKGGMRRNFLTEADIEILYYVGLDIGTGFAVAHVAPDARRFSELAEAGYLVLIPSDLGDFHVYKLAQNGQQALNRRTRGKGNDD